MRILVLADTHVPSRSRGLPAQVWEACAHADAIIHLGDFTSADVAGALEEHAPLYAVHGNNDSEEIRLRFPAIRRVTLQGYRFVLLHGHLGGRTAVAAARSVLDADAVLFGHSHRGFNSHENGVLLFNPGSPTDRRWAPNRSFGVLDVDDEIRSQLFVLP